jgi:hypothetical protein
MDTMVARSLSLMNVNMEEGVQAWRCRSKHRDVVQMHTWVHVISTTFFQRESILLTPLSSDFQTQPGSTKTESKKHYPCTQFPHVCFPTPFSLLACFVAPELPGRMNRESVIGGLSDEQRGPAKMDYG